MQRDLLKMYEEVTIETPRSSLTPKRDQGEAVSDLLHMIMSILERIELHTEYRALTFGQIPTMNITVKLDSKADTSLGVVEVNPMLVTSYNPVDSVRLTHDSERLKQLALPKGSLRASYQGSSYEHSLQEDEESKTQNFSSFNQQMEPKEA